MKDASRPVSLGLFVLILLCFLLPVARVSCSKQVVVQATGYQVAFGKEVPSQPDSTGGKKTWEGRPAAPDFVAIVCLVAALVGIGLVLVKERRGAIVRAIFSGHYLLLFIALWAELQQRAGGAQLQMLAGYWAALGLSAAAFVVNLLSIRRLRSEPAGSG